LHLKLINLESQVGHAGGKIVVDTLQVLLATLKPLLFFPLLDTELVGCNSVSFPGSFNAIATLLGCMSAVAAGMARTANR
jgi:hypothetical protein